MRTRCECFILQQAATQPDDTSGLFSEKREDQGGGVLQLCRRRGPQSTFTRLCGLGEQYLHYLERVKKSFVATVPSAMPSLSFGSVGPSCFSLWPVVLLDTTGILRDNFLAGAEHRRPLIDEDKGSVRVGFKWAGSRASI